jgi:hypothetical protein
VSWYPSSFADNAATQAATQAATNAATNPAGEGAVYAILGSLRRAALDEGCTRIQLFSQAVGPVKAALMEEKSAEGVCRELAVRWLASKNNDDGDTFLAALLGLGGTVNADELKEVVEAFKAMGDKNIIEQRAYTEMELKEYFQHVSQTEILRAPLRSDQAPTKSAVEWLFSPALQCEYRFFGIRGQTNHATAICLASGKESFFDPNLGAFEFKDRPQNMCRFMDKYIFPKGGDGRGRYIGREHKAFYDIERVCCA